MHCALNSPTALASSACLGARFQWFVHKHGGFKFTTDQLRIGERDQGAHHQVFTHLIATTIPRDWSSFRSDEAQIRPMAAPRTRTCARGSANKPVPPIRETLPAASGSDAATLIPSDQPAAQPLPRRAFLGFTLASAAPRFFDASSRHCLSQCCSTRQCRQRHMWERSGQPGSSRAAPWSPCRHSRHGCIAAL